MVNNVDPDAVIRRRPKKIGVTDRADFEERRELIRMTAAKLFAQRGYMQATIGDIAKELGVSKPTLYHYFSNKDAIMLAIFQSAESHMAHLLDAATSTTNTGYEAFKKLFFLYGDGISNDAARCMIRTDYNLLNDETRQFVFDYQEKVISDTADLLNAGMEDGSVRRSDPRILSLNFYFAMNSISAWQSRYGEMSMSYILNETWATLSNGLRSK